MTIFHLLKYPISDGCPTYEELMALPVIFRERWSEILDERQRKFAILRLAGTRAMTSMDDDWIYRSKQLRQFIMDYEGPL